MFIILINVVLKNLLMIRIVGAGPAGNYAAYLLADKFDVEVHEEHKAIGEPIQCTGILTGDLKEFLHVEKQFLVNMIKRVRVYSKNNEARFTLQNPNYVVHRALFDSHIAELAKEKGAKYNLHSKFLGCAVHDEKVHCQFSDGEKDADYLIGADGPHSAVARSVGIFGKRRFYFGLQATVKRKFEKDLVEFYIGKHYIGWVVPENEEYARVGVSSETIAAEKFKEVIAKVGGKIVARQAGPIPIYQNGIKTSFREKVFLIGDAACQVKASTHGGIIPGLVAASALAQALKTGSSYDILWKKRLAKDLKIHAMIKKMMDNFSDDDFNYLLKLMNQERVQKIIEEHDREFPSRFATRLILKEPRFLRFLTKVL